MKISALFLALITWSLPCFSGGLSRVNVGLRGSIDDLVFITAREKGYFRAEGIDARLVPVRAGGDAALKALASGVVDAARASLVFTMNEALKASGAKMVADNSHAEKGRPSSSYYLVRADLAGRVKSYGDLRGLSVALPSQGSLSYMAFLRDLEAAGLSEKDLRIKSHPFDVRPILMANRELDFAFVLEPQAGLLAESGMARPFAGTNVAAEDYPMSLLFYSRRLLKDRRLGLGFMRAYLKAASELGSMGAAELRAAAEKALGAPVSEAAAASMLIYPDGRIDTRFVMELQDYAFRKGVAKVKLGEGDLFDMSFASQAAAELAAGK